MRFLVVFVLCSPAIISECRGDPPRMTFGATQLGGPNRRLTGPFYLYTKTVAELSECVVWCQYDTSCRSFNVRASGLNYACEMNREKGNFARNLVATAGFEHFVMNKPEDPGIYGAGRDTDKGYWFYYRVKDGRDYCFMFAADAFGGSFNWKAFYTHGVNITEVLTLPNQDPGSTVTNFTWYIGDGTMRRAHLDTTYGGADKTVKYTDFFGTHLTLDAPVSIASVHGPSSPPLVDAAITYDNVTFLLHNDTVYELASHDPLGQVAAIYPMSSTDARNPFTHAPTELTAASMDAYPLARMYGGLRWVVYNLQTRAYASYGYLLS